MTASGKRLKDRICVVGLGWTAFGEHFDRSYADLLADASRDAMQDAGVEQARIDAAWLGTAFPDAGVFQGRSGMDLAEALGMFDIPITRVSNYCATGAEAVRGAVNALLAGECSVALAAGVEKLRDRAPQDSLVKMMVEGGHPYYQKGFTAAGTFAMYANRYCTTYGVTREQLAAVSVKNHAHACLNPKAHYRREVTTEQVLRSPMVADPLTVMDSCPTTDGAAAVVLVRAEDAAKFSGVPVYLKGLGLAVSSGWDLPFFDESHELLSFRATRVAARTAYAEAGVRDPRKQIDLAEVHDCFSIVELLTCEDLGFCGTGEAAALVSSGATRRDGDIPVNVSGGLLSCGHPVGATGLRMVCEIAEHLRGTAGDRQIPGARLGLTHNIGGPGAVAAVMIFGGEPDR
ncbi:MAG: acetyl-CoA acetyltransferase [Phycisphaerae bacterium]